MFTASFVAAGAGSVGIASAGTTSGNNSIGGGNQVFAPISIPANVCGNAVALLGGAFAACRGGASVDAGGGSGMMTSGNDSILGGNQVRAPVSVPVNVCGNAVALLGHAHAACRGGASVRRDDDDGGGPGMMTSGNDSIGGGNQVRAPIRVPVEICGNAVNAAEWCPGGAFVHTVSWASGGPRTSGNDSILGGNQVRIPVRIPVNVCGNAVAVLGGAFAACEGGARVGDPAPAASPVHLLAHLAPTAARTARATLLSQTSAAAPGMGSGSVFAVAFGALLAGAASLVAAGRRLGTRKAGR
jgi:hypothetical protein